MLSKILRVMLMSWAAVVSAGAETPYIPGSGWKTFTFRNPNSSDDRRNADGEFSFTVYPGQNAILTVTDGGWNNEKFEIFNKGTWTGWTTGPTGPAGSIGQYYTSSFDTASQGYYWSEGSWPLPGGTYRLSFELAQWNRVKTDVVGADIYTGGFKVEITQTPDADGDGIADQFETGTGIYISPVDTGTDPSKSDTDGDGVDDWTEVYLLGTDPNKADTDGDGYSDAAEIQAGTSPTDANSKPSTTLEIRTAVEVTLYTKTGTNYQVEWSEDLNTWTAFPEIIVGDGNPATRFYTTHNTPARYYRPVEIAP